MLRKQFTLIPAEELSNAQYHEQLPIEEHSFSSSQFKDILKSEELFYDAHIKGDEGNKVSTSLQAVFDTGSYFHTAILEPHLLEKDYALFTGKMRSGAAWIKFRDENTDRGILTLSDKNKADMLIKGVEANPVSSKIYSGGQSETSLFVTYHVTEDTVYLQTPKKLFMLTPTGWAGLPKTTKLSESAIAVRVKVRCDYSNKDLGYIADLKSTTGNPKDLEETKAKIKKYGYEFSAQLYMDAFNAYELYTGGKACYTDFIWTFATKDYVQSQDWFMSAEQKAIGRSKEIKALLLLAKNLREGWDFQTSIMPMEADVWELRDWCPDFKASEGSDNSIKKIIEALTVEEDEEELIPENLILTEAESEADCL